MLWYLSRLSVVALTFTIMIHTVHANEQLPVSIMFSNPQNAFPPHCESVGGMLDALHHGHVACLPSKTPFWFNFSSPAFILPEIAAQTIPWCFNAMVNRTAPTKHCNLTLMEILNNRNYNQKQNKDFFINRY